MTLPPDHRFNLSPYDESPRPKDPIPEVGKRHIVIPTDMSGSMTGMGTIKYAHADPNVVWMSMKRYEDLATWAGEDRISPAIQITSDETKTWAQLFAGNK